MNQTVIVGRLVDNPKLEKTDNGKKVMNMTVAVPRTYKNERLVKTQEHVKHYDGSFELIFEELREYYDNGILKEVWNSDGDFFEFDKRGNFID